MKGSVILVGAGPGDPGLLTGKGREALEQAEVVVYDRLVSPGILELIPPGAEAIDVGKQAGSHPVPQTEINAILLRKALAGKRVVRLKGGDPFLFGRGGEELELLAENGVPFQVVPGVSSALAAPAYAGIPVTHRDFCSSLHILTGHARAGAELHMDFDALRRAGGTLVFLMGAASLPQICWGLLDAGMPPETPAAIVEQGTLPGQRKVVSTLSELPGAAQRAEIRSPAVIVVGGVCALSERFDWFDALPLKGRFVVVTRPAERSGELSRRLRALGAQVTDYPCIRIVPRAPCPELDKALEALQSFRWLVFTSPAGPELFFRRLRAFGKDARALAGLRVAAIGPRTAQAVSDCGITPDLVPEIWDSPHLAEAMSDAAGPVLLCRAGAGSPELPEMFRKKGTPFADVPCYDTVYASPEPSRVLELLKRPCLVTFTSASTVRGFVCSLPEGTDFSNVTGCCIGPQTAKAAERYGIAVKTAARADMDALLETILNA